MVKFVSFLLMFCSGFALGMELELHTDTRSVEKWLEENRNLAHPAEILRAELLLQHQLDAIPKGYENFPKFSFSLSGENISDELYLLNLAKVSKDLERAQTLMEGRSECLEGLECLRSGSLEMKADVAIGSESSECPVCTDGFLSGEIIVKESCGHIYHAPCVKQGLLASLHGGNDKNISCLVKDCPGYLSPLQAASLCLQESVSTRIQMQKMLLSHLEKVVFCPSCGLGVKRSEHAASGACGHCAKEVCFDCGYTSHRGESCDLQLEKQKTYREVLSKGLNVGLCPHCDCLMERGEGCSIMRCGDNAHTTNDVSNRGCGREFQWPDRKPVPNDLKDIPDRSKKTITTHFKTLSPDDLQRHIFEGKPLFDIANVIGVSSVEEALDVIRLGGKIRGRFLASEVSEGDREILMKYGCFFIDGKSEKSWGYTYKEDGFTYYVMTLAGVDFEFVEVPGKRILGILGKRKSFFMMSHWVTQGQWFAVMGENPAGFAGRGLDFPMESISYNDVVNNFLPRLNVLLQGASFEGKFKLPGDAQWQRMADKNVAAEFASNKPKYSDFGQNWDSGQPLSVKSKDRGNLGAWMFGTVWEWVGTLNASGLVALRGGSWADYSENVGPSAHFSYRSDHRARNFGFRLLRALP
ncbi:MAG: SUMF1/EgtB/PvdO family nonheme iron enzyme [Oligoflexales bacterium]